MLRSKTQWSVATSDARQRELAASLARELSLSPLVAGLLVQRGVPDVEAARQFLYGGPEGLHDPFLLSGMREAVDRIRLARERGEHVRIYGDYDADGVSSTALMTFLFRRLELKFDSYIPHRMLEGYGLNDKALDLAAEAGVGLIVTVDTGISAVNEIEHAARLGIDVIVTDHHEPPERLPAALALINPKQASCRYPFKGLAGVGVAFKLAQALLDEPPLEWTDIVALGTIADLMPLTDENRILVRLGLERLRRTDKPGLRALADIAGAEPATLNSTSVAFGMAPRVNAAGRIDHAREALDLLTCSDDGTAIAAAARLDELNRQRQQIVESIVEAAERQWADKLAEAASAGREEPSVIVLAAENWNVGVVGIVASKFVEKYYKPAFILGIDSDGQCKGSARSIDGFDLHAALTRCESLLDHYGGHQAAAGMTLHRNKLPLLEAGLEELAGQWLSGEDWVPKTYIDMECGMSDTTMDVLQQLAKLEPFGAGNAAPKLLLKGVRLADRRTIGKGSKHLKLSLSGEGRLLDAVGFGFGSVAGRLTDGADIELVGELSLNEWNGQRRTQFMVSDMRVGHVQLFDKREESGCESFAAVSRLAESEGMGGETAVLVPSPAWLEAASANEARELPAALRVVTYEQACGEPPVCSRLLLLGKPPSADKLSAVLSACRGLEAVYALYEKDRGSGSTRGRLQGKAAGSRAAAGRPESQQPAFRETDREQFGRLYQTLRQLGPIPHAGAAGRLAIMMGWRPETVTFMLDVFGELDFVEINGGQLKLAASPAKKELAHSPSYRDALRRAESDRILLADGAELSAWIAAQSGKSSLSIVEGVGVS